MLCEARTSASPEDTEANGGWKYTTRLEEIDIFLKKSPDSPLNGTKGVGYISAPAEIISFIFASSTRRTVWDDMYAGGKVLDIVDQFTSVVWSGFKAAWPVSGRDFVCIGRQERWADGSIFNYNCSVTHPKMPEEKNYIRAELTYCGVLVQPQPTPEDPLRCRIVYTVVSDPKGSLPVSLVNAANIKQPCVIATIRKFLAKPGMMEAVKGDHAKFIAAVRTLLTKRGKYVSEDSLPPALPDPMKVDVFRLTYESLQQVPQEATVVPSNDASANQVAQASPNLAEPSVPAQASAPLSTTAPAPAPATAAVVLPQVPVQAHAQVQVSAAAPAQAQAQVQAKVQAQVQVQAQAQAQAPAVPSAPPQPGLDQSQYAVLVGPLPPSKYDDRLRAAYEMAWRAVSRNEDDGWKFKLEQDGVKVYLKSDPNGGELNFSKGIGIIAGSPEMIRAMYCAPGTRPLWDEMYDTGEVIEQIDPNTTIGYAAFKAPWPVSGRDFCTIGRSIVNPDGSILVYHADYQHPKAPKKKGLVRGELIYSALYAKPIPGNPSKSEVIYAVGSNPKGSLPTNIVNAVNVKQPLCVARIGHVIATNRAALDKAMEAERQKFRALVPASAQVPSVAQASAAPSALEEKVATSPSSQSVPAVAAASQVGEDEYEDPDKTGYSLSLRPLPPSPYDEKLRACEELAWRAVTRGEDDGWKCLLEQDGIKVYQKPNPSGGEINFCKGVGIIDGSPETVRCVFAASSLRTKWDDMFDRGDILEVVDTNTMISYGALKAPWPVSPRDFCTVGRAIVKPDGSIFMFNTTVDHPKAKPVKGNVRSEVIYSAILIKPVPGQPNKSEVFYSVGSDPKGSIPTGIVNAANIKMPLLVARVGEFIRKNPEDVKEAHRIARQLYDRAVAEIKQRRKGQLAAEGDDVVSSLRRGEAIPGVVSIRWPELSPEEAENQNSCHDEVWRRSAVLFANQTTKQHFTCVRQLLKTTGYFPLRDATDEMAATRLAEQLSDFEIGVLSLKLGGLRGTYASVLDEMNLRCLMQVDGRELLSASAVKDVNGTGFPTFFGTANSRVCFPLCSAKSQLQITLLSCTPSGNAKSVVGSLNLTFGELFEGSSRIDTCAARRGWYALGNLPREIDRAAARKAIQLRNASVANKGKDGSTGVTTNEMLRALDEPPGLFICLESNVVYSLQRWFATTALTTQPTTLAKEARPAGSLQLRVPPCTSREASLLINQQSRLERDATDASALLTGAGKLGDVANDEASFARSVIDPSTLSNPLEVVNPLASGAEFFVPELLVHNVTRLAMVGAPLLNLFTEARRICTWADPSRSAVALAFWIALVQLPHLIPTVLCILFLWIALLSAANWHFREASSRSATTYALQLKQRENYAAIYAQQLRALYPSLSSRSKALLLALQTSTGRLASLLDRFVGLFTWSAGNEVTGFLCVVATLLLILSRFLPPQRVALVAIYFIAGWHTSLLSTLRHTVNCLIHFHTQLSNMHRDCELLRLLALRSHIAPDTTLVGRDGLVVESS